jgi:hypothetical protein
MNAAAAQNGLAWRAARSLRLLELEEVPGSLF